MIIHADKQLAARLESVQAKNQVEYVLAHNSAGRGAEAAYEKIGSGYAVFAGLDSPLTQAFGLGFDGQVGEDQIAALEEFYARRGAAVNVEVCHLSDLSLTAALTKRGYGVVEYSNVLVRPLSGDDYFPESPCGAEIRRVAEGEVDQFAEAVTAGFSEQLEAMPSLVDIFRIYFRQSNCTCVAAFKGERAVGGGALFITDGVAELGGTSTLPDYRNLGIHKGMIRRRLNVAVERGCDLAMVTTLPGTVSQRNFEKLGFHVVYSRTKFLKSL
jgi:GNAT superfamily N-acetyltransferase